VTSTTITETNLRVLIADENESALRRLHELKTGRLIGPSEGLRSSGGT
jgi:hypothetical protein